MAKRSPFAILFFLLFTAFSLAAQEGGLDDATIAALESVMGGDPSNFPYTELDAITEMSLSTAGMWDFGRDLRIGSGLHAGLLPNDWVYLAAELQGLYGGGPLPYLDSGGIFAQAEGMLMIIHWKKRYLDDYGFLAFVEDSLLGIELGACAEFRAWRNLQDSDNDGPWGSTRYFSHEGDSSDFRAWAGLGFMTVQPASGFGFGKMRFRSSLRFLAGMAEGRDTITMESDGSTENQSFSLPTSYGGVVRIEGMFPILGLACELGYYRGFHAAFSLSLGWTF